MFNAFFLAVLVMLGDHVVAVRLVELNVLEGVFFAFNVMDYLTLLEGERLVL